MKRIGVDMDGVLCDLLHPWIKAYNKDYNDNFKTDMITNWYWHEGLKCGEEIYKYLQEDYIFTQAPVIKNSQIVLHKLHEKYEIFIVTAHTYAKNVIPKERWLKKHFPFIPDSNYVFVKNKSIVNVDVMIDDRVENLDSIECPEKILFTASHNKLETKYTRVNNWLEIAKYFNLNWEVKQ